VTSQTQPDERKPERSSRHKSKSVVIGAVIGPIVAAMSIATALIICCRRYRIKRELIDAEEEGDAH
jgi:Ca2+/Na+ antiporter